MGKRAAGGEHAQHAKPAKRAKTAKRATRRKIGMTAIAPMLAIGRRRSSRGATDGCSSRSTTAFAFWRSARARRRRAHQPKRHRQDASVSRDRRRVDRSTEARASDRSWSTARSSRCTATRRRAFRSCRAGCTSIDRAAIASHRDRDAGGADGVRHAARRTERRSSPSRGECAASISPRCSARRRRSRRHASAERRRARTARRCCDEARDARVGRRHREARRRALRAGPAVARRGSSSRSSAGRSSSSAAGPSRATRANTSARSCSATMTKTERSSTPDIPAPASRGRRCSTCTEQLERHRAARRRRSRRHPRRTSRRTGRGRRSSSRSSSTNGRPDGQLRQPVFVGVRDDKAPREVIREPESNVSAETARRRRAERQDSARDEAGGQSRRGSDSRVRRARYGGREGRRAARGDHRRRRLGHARAPDRHARGLEPRQGVLPGDEAHEGRRDALLRAACRRICCRRSPIGRWS